jgi:hypothetical protein
VVANDRVVAVADVDETGEVIQPVVDPEEGCPGLLITQEVIGGHQVFRAARSEDHLPGDEKPAVVSAFSR